MACLPPREPVLSPQAFEGPHAGGDVHLWQQQAHQEAFGAPGAAERQEQAHAHGEIPSRERAGGASAIRRTAE